MTKKIIDLKTLRVLYLPTGEPVYARHFLRTNLYAGTKWAPLWVVMPCGEDGQPLTDFVWDLTDDKPNRRWLLNSTEELSEEEWDLWVEYCIVADDSFSIPGFNDWMKECDGDWEGTLTVESGLADPGSWDEYLSTALQADFEDACERLEICDCVDCLDAWIDSQAPEKDFIALRNLLRTIDNQTSDEVNDATFQVKVDVNLTHGEITAAVKEALQAAGYELPSEHVDNAVPSSLLYDDYSLQGVLNSISPDVLDLLYGEDPGTVDTDETPEAREADLNNWRVTTVPQVVLDGDCLLLQYRVEIEFLAEAGLGYSPEWDVVNSFTTYPTIDHDSALELAVDLGRDAAEILRAEALRANGMGADDA